MTVATSAFGTVAESGAVQIVSTLQDPANYGGCMARISPGPAAGNLAALNCTRDIFVTFDCLNTSGQTSKSSAIQMFDTAQLAFVTGKNVNVVVDDSVKINDFCLVRRIDLQ